VRLNAYLARAGIASRRGSDDLIKQGRVKINDEPGQLNTYVHAGDRVEVDGEPVAAQQLTYVLLNKPRGYVTTLSDPQGRPVVAIGGITLERAPDVLAAGAASVAVISDLLRDDPAKMVRLFLERLGDAAP